MAKHTVRFEGSFNLGNHAEVKRFVPLLSDHQLEYFFKVTKNPVFAKAHAVILDEMVQRVITTCREVFGA
jgi:hypothetical protein